MINIPAILRVIEAILHVEAEIDPSTPMTPEMGALVRDKGEQRALESAALRRQMGQFHDLQRCSEFVVSQHRRRVKR